MARPKKPKYEYVEKLLLYRKRVKDVNGKYVAVYGRTPDELTEKLVEFSELQALGAEYKDNPFFNDYAQRWMDLHGANLTFGGRTDYQSCIDCNIKPYMQGKRIKEVRPDDIKELMLGVVEKSESIYTKTYMLVKQILTSACENGLIATNPCPTIHKGGVPAKERQALTREQTAVLLDAVRDTKAYLFCMIGLYAGLRREEILGHTYITNLLLAGVDVKTVQYLAGHERAKITLDIYAHLTYNRPEEILSKVNLAFSER